MNCNQRRNCIRLSASGLIILVMGCSGPAPTGNVQAMWTMIATRPGYYKLTIDGTVYSTPGETEHFIPDPQHPWSYYFYQQSKAVPVGSYNVKLEFVFMTGDPPRVLWDNFVQVSAGESIIVNQSTLDGVEPEEVI